jgi:hypothetical protein
VRSCILRCLTLPALVLCAGCSELTRVSAPDITSPNALENGPGAIVKTAGAISSFSTAFSDQVLHTGFITDEFTDVSGATYPEDKRETVIQPNGVYPYDELSTARIAALRAIGTLQLYNPNPADRIGKLFAFLGYAEVFFAENMCSGVPIGIVVNDLPTYGPTLNRTAMLQRALADFDSAATYARGSDSITNMVRVGRGRAFLASGNFSGAGAAVDSVPLTFVYSTAYSDSTAQINSLYNATQTFASVSDREGVNGLPFVSAGDPRVVTQSITNASGVQVVAQQLYTSGSSPIVLASGIEARLIQAEAAYQAADVGTWASDLNALRETAIQPAIPDLPPDSTTAAPATMQVDVMFRERAFWLFLTGHRHGDLRRLIDTYGRATETVFPTGAYQGGPQQYGHDAVFIPFGEIGNPNYRGCASLSP